MRALISVGALLVCLAATGCGGSYCDRSSPCKNDVQPTPAQRDSCKASLSANANANCFNEGLAYANCAADNVVCGADGKSDGTLSRTKQQNNCSALGTNVFGCCAKNPTSTICKQ